MFQNDIEIGEGKNINLVTEGGHRAYINFANYNLLRKSDLSYLTQIHFDGISIVYLYNIFTSNNIPRKSFDFTSDAEDIFKLCIGNNKKVCFIGGNKTEARVLKQKLKSANLSLPSWEFHSGYISETGNDDWSEYLIHIGIKKFDLVILGLGAPLQEFVGSIIAQDYISVSTITCGAFISQTAKGKKLSYYPNVFNRLHLRWLYRVFNEPHVIRRLLLVYPYNMILFTLDTLRR